MHEIALAEPTTMPIYPSCQTQVASLTRKETGLPTKYSNFSNVFSSNSAAELPEYTGINNHPINLLNNKQPPYNLIYSLGLVELKILNYIKANLVSSFIRSSKSSTSTLILFAQKKNSSLRLCVDYWRLNNLIMKNCYPLLLIDKLLDCLGSAKRFTQLNLMNAYYQMRIGKGNE